VDDIPIIMEVLVY